MRQSGSKKRPGFVVLGWIAAASFSILIVVVLIAGMSPPAIPTTPAGWKQMQSLYVPMADGTKIAVRIALPRDLQPGQQIPAIVEATRYQTDIKSTFLLNLALKLGGDVKANLGSGHIFLEQGYAYVRIDARGSGASFGSREMEWSKPEIEDIGQVIDWVAGQPWSNGRVGTYGISYSGNTAELAVALNNPHLLAAAPLYADFEPMVQSVMPGGILNTYLIETWSLSNARADANMVKGLLMGGIAPVDEDPDEVLLALALQERENIDVPQAVSRVTYVDDPIAAGYTAQSIAPFTCRDEIERSGVPFYVQVGWLDAGTVDGALARFLTYENDQLLVIGPWNHAGYQLYDPLLETDISRAALQQEQARAVAAFFDRYLKESEPDPVKKEIRYYTMGEGAWKTTTVWPVAGFDAALYYLYPDGSLQETRPEDAAGSNLYTVDFSATTGESNRWRTQLGGLPIVYPDRAAEDQKLLTYTGAPLEHDVEITGNPIVTLNLSSSATDGAFYVYLEAVAPDGKVIYITEGQLRALHRRESSRDLGRAILGPRHSYERADGQALVPGENTELRIGMYATSVLIQKGYRLRIAIAGHDASQFARIPAGEEPAIEVQTNGRLPSYVELPIRIRE